MIAKILFGLVPKTYTFMKEGMSMATTRKMVEWMCTHCGTKVHRSNLIGRPMPGKCPKRTGNRPHVWVKNREY